MKLYDDPQQEEMIWRVREDGLGSTGLGAGAARRLAWLEDSAVPVAAVPQYLRELRHFSTSSAIGPRFTATSGRAASTAGCSSICIPSQESTSTRGSWMKRWRWW